MNIQSRFALLFLLLLILVSLALGFQAYAPRNQAWLSSSSGVSVIPNTSTAVPNAGAGVVELDKGWFSNSTGSTVTLSIGDGTTNCNGAACQVFPAVSVAANSVVSVDFGRLPVSGVTWSASAANSLQGYIKGWK